MTILVVGDANADLTALISHFPREGDDSLVHALSWGSGGSATNTAVALARLGMPTRLMARVGTDPMAQIALRAATQAGVDLRDIQIDEQLATGLCYAAISPNGERSFFSYRGANVALGQPEFDSVLPSIDWLHIGGHALIEQTQRETVLAIIAAAIERQIPLSLDLCLPLIRTQREHLIKLLPALTVLFANDTELSLLALGDLPDVAEVKPVSWYTARIRAQATMVAGTIVGKCGALGCVIDTGNTQIVPGFNVHVADTNGCGDAFVAGFLMAQLAGAPVELCGQIGNACGALAASRPGAAESLPSLVELRAFLKDIPERIAHSA